MSQYNRFSLVDLSEGLDAIKKHKSGDVRVILGGQAVGLSSLRLKTFAQKGTTCFYCKLKATHFAIEKTQGSKLEIYHMNLWGLRNGNEVLFTHDHVHARSLGGADNISNSVTACTDCNGKKAKYENKVKMKLPYKMVISYEELIEKVKECFNESVLKFFPIKT